MVKETRHICLDVSGDGEEQGDTTTQAKPSQATPRQNKARHEEVEFRIKTEGRPQFCYGWLIFHLLRPPK